MQLDDHLAHGLVEIRLGTGAPAPDRLAARELATYLEALSGHAVPIVEDRKHDGARQLLVGDAALENPGSMLAEDEVHLEAGSNDYIIRGGGPRGTLYAVYELLEALGVRWFHPEETFIPEHATIDLPRALRRRPSFEYREAHWYTAYSDTTFAARLRYNGSMAQVPQNQGGHWGWQPYVHSFFTAVPPADYAATHPEYYSYRHGQGRVIHGGQLCLSNPDVLDILTDFALEQMANPLVRIVDLSQMDHANPCECPDCAATDQAAGSPAGSIIAMCNEVATRTSRVHPDKSIGTLAYTYSLKAPHGIQAHPNVLVRLCHMNGCETHPLDGCERNRAFLDTLQAWHQVAKRLYVWDYVTNFQHVLCFHPNFGALEHDIQLLREAGVTGLFLQGFAEKGVVFEELHSYAMGRCLWDADRDYHAEARDFLSGYYGHAAGPLLWEMIQILQSGHSPDFHLHLYRHPHQGTFQPDQLRRAQNCLDRAIAAAGDHETHRRRLDQVALWMDFTRMATTDPLSQRGQALHIEAADQEAPQRYHRVLQGLNRFGITKICEYPTSMNDLEIAWKWSIHTRDLPLTVLANDHLHLALCPELNGSICSLQDKQTGIDILCKPEPTILGYPYITGLIEVYHINDSPQGTYAFDRWRLESSTRTQATLRIQLEPAVHIRRTISLVDNTIHCRTEICNQGAERCRIKTQSFLQMRVGNLADNHFYKHDATGTPTPLENSLTMKGDIQEQWVNLAGAAVPTREWGFHNRVAGIGLSETVDRDIEFCGSNACPLDNHILMECRLSPLPVEPQTTISCERTYRINRRSPAE